MKIKEALQMALKKLDGVKISFDDSIQAAEARAIIEGCINAIGKMEEEAKAVDND